MRHKSGHLGDVPITTADIYKTLMVLSLTSLNILHSSTVRMELLLSLLDPGRETEAHMLRNFTQGTEADY